MAALQRPSYDLPICENNNGGSDTNEFSIPVVSIPESFSLINQAGMCLDASNNPVIATWWAPGTPYNNFRRQYLIIFPDTNGIWQTRQYFNRTNDPIGTMESSAASVTDLGRPVIVCDKQNRLLVIYRDNFGSNGLTVAFTQPYAIDPARTNWTTMDLTTDNLGSYEPVIDLARWQRDNVLDLVYLACDGEGYTDPGNTASPSACWNGTKSRISASAHVANEFDESTTGCRARMEHTARLELSSPVQHQSGQLEHNHHVERHPHHLERRRRFLPLQFVQTNGAQPTAILAFAGRRKEDFERVAQTHLECPMQID